MSSETSAELSRATNPSRMERWGLQPQPVDVLGPGDGRERARESTRGRARQPFTKAEREVSGRIEQSLDRVRDAKDAMSERMFKAIYEAPWLAAAVGLGADALGRRGPPSATWEQDELKRLKRQEIESQFESRLGARCVGTDVALRAARGKRGRRTSLQPDAPHDRRDGSRAPPALAAVKAAIKRQAFVLALDEERAIAALPALVPEMHLRRKGVEAARRWRARAASCRRTRRSASGGWRASCPWMRRCARGERHEPPPGRSEGARTAVRSTEVTE